MLKVKRLSRTRMIIGATFAASLLTAGFVIVTTNVALGKSTATPKTTYAGDVVATGTVNCKSGYGEIGFSPASGSSPTASMEISVWLEATGCKSASKPAASPVPTDVFLSFSVEEDALPTTTCPLSGQWPGNANLAYNAKAYPFPPEAETIKTKGLVGPSIIDPSIAASATLTTGGTSWTINAQTSWWGSYAPGTNFVASFHPYWLDATGYGSCTTGQTSGWADDVSIDNI
jgi:hypothetical protein